ncbi:MAG: hypothetical protein R3323_00070 [Wenzhouxiangellaceae bacterium]|nr:hypothetical protein [Wenzhouxiangellaceae bacterium]
MNNPLIADTARIAFPLLAAAMLVSASEPARAACQPGCLIEIHVPGDPQRPPEAQPSTVRAQPGDVIDFDADRGVVVEFPEDTPFVGAGGQPVHVFTVNGQRPMTIRDDVAVCREEPGCKYIVRDPSDPGRPPLDPYIIVY